MSSNVTVIAVKKAILLYTLCASYMYYGLLEECIQACSWIHQDFQMAVSINFQTELCDSSSVHMTIYSTC